MATATTGKPCTVKPPAVKDQLPFIGGRFVDGASNKTFPALNPTTGETLCQVAEADKADVEAAVQAAHKALDADPTYSVAAAKRGA